MAATQRWDAGEIISGKSIWGGRGLGVLAEDIPATGKDGPGFLYPSLDLPADNGKQIRGHVLTFPESFAPDEYSRFVHSPGTDGSRTASVQIYENGTAVGSPITITLNVGAAQADTIPPVITLNGSSVVFINQNDTYTELGATALDDVDGNVSGGIVITGSVNTATLGLYQITYTVSDAALNEAQSVRSVIVRDPSATQNNNGFSLKANINTCLIEVLQ